MSVIGLEKFHNEKLRALYSQNTFQGIKSRSMWRGGGGGVINKLIKNLWFKTTNKKKNFK
jgi:hypothetical protein